MGHTDLIGILTAIQAGALRQMLRAKKWFCKTVFVSWIKALKFP